MYVFVAIYIFTEGAVHKNQRLKKRRKPKRRNTKHTHTKSNATKQRTYVCTYVFVHMRLFLHVTFGFILIMLYMGMI